MRIVVLGKGAFGKAMFTLVSPKNSDITFWNRGTPITDADALILTVPTQVIREALGFVQTKRMPFIINCSKGIESETYKLPHQIVQDVLGSGIKYFSLMGPSFSQEIIEGMPTLVNLGYAGTHVTREEQKQIKDLFQTSYFRVRLTESLQAIEFAGAYKNVYAIAAGMVDGLGFGLNTRAKIIALAVEEMMVLVEQLGFPLDPHALPAIIGDIVLSCSSVESRNFRFGRLVIDHGVPDALQLISATVEGYKSSESVRFFTEKIADEAPLVNLVYDILYAGEKQSVREKMTHFFKKV